MTEPNGTEPLSDEEERELRVAHDALKAVGDGPCSCGRDLDRFLATLSRERARAEGAEKRLALLEDVARAARGLAQDRGMLPDYTSHLWKHLDATLSALDAAGR